MLCCKVITEPLGSFLIIFALKVSGLFFCGSQSRLLNFEFYGRKKTQTTRSHRFTETSESRRFKFVVQAHSDFSCFSSYMSIYEVPGTLG